MQQTVRRNLSFISPEDLYIVTGATYFHDVVRQIKTIHPKLEANIIVEPAAKNTAPALEFALRSLKVAPDELFLVTPADHIIAPVEKYREHVLAACQFAQKGFLVTFGIRPSRPETGYGYIKTQGSIVEKFVEKPDLKTAQKYVQSGDYFWNSGMFLFSAVTFHEEMRKHCPEIATASFEAMPSISIDYAVMEKSDRVAMVPLDLTWSDIGSWENVYELLEKDEQQNAIQGDAVTLQTTNSLILAQSRLVATIGVRDLLVVETEDVVLVADKKEAQQVRQIVDQLKHLGKKEAREHLTTQRPWGAYTVLLEGERYKIKKIQVHPQQKLSLQMHYHRSEHWVIVSGTAKVTIQDKETIVHEGESIFVPKSAIHRVENPGKVVLEIIEVQVGEYLGEDDILRLEDIYGRLKEEEVFKILVDTSSK